MAHTARLLKRGLDILITEGPVELFLRAAHLGKYLLESEYYGRMVDRDSPYEYHGVSLPLDMDVFDNRVRHAFATGTYETTEVELIDRYVTGSYDLIDLGASTGFTAVYGLRKLDERARGVAVEANPEMIPVIESVREMSGEDFDVEHAAYAPEQSDVTFHVHGKTVSGSTKKQGERAITVPGVTLAEIAAEHDIGEFVCLADIEGGEIDLFRHELGLLEEWCALIVVELHEIDGIAAASRRLLEDSPFRQIDSLGDVYVYRNESL